VNPAADSVLRVGDLPRHDFIARLRGAGLALRLGPFDVLIQSRVGAIDADLHHLYSEYPLLAPGQDYSFHARIEPGWQWFPRPRRMVRFIVDGRAPHPDLPRDQALAVLEWGMNLVIALRYHCFLMLHAAVVERNGRALVLPAAPGSGKSTLCAALVHRGWRLLSDEFGLVRPGSINFLPLPRLLPLKNDSLAVMDSFAPGAEWGPVIHNTRKGTIRHMRPPRASIDRAGEPAAARWIIFPQWQAGAALDLQPVPRVEGFAQIASNAFNYEMLGIDGFRTVRGLVETCACYTLDYSSLDEAVAAIDALEDANAR
jgi:HprK-related kinase A